MLLGAPATFQFQLLLFQPLVHFTDGVRKTLNYKLSYQPANLLFHPGYKNRKLMEKNS